MGALERAAGKIKTLCWAFYLLFGSAVCDFSASGDCDKKLIAPTVMAEEKLVGKG